jgi:hypothetical protein
MPAYVVSGESFEELASRFEQLSALEISEVLVEETIAAIQDGFLRGEDPEGDPWAELTIRAGQPLRDSGGLMAAWDKTFDASGFEVFNGKAYADYHQKGTGVHGPHAMKIIPTVGRALKIPGVGFRASVQGAPARKMVPDEGLPDAWAQRYDSALIEYLEGLLDS